MDFELCGKTEEIPKGKNLGLEIKYDGIRVAWCQDKLINRYQNDVTRQFPEIKPVFPGVLDGEIVVFYGENEFKTDFELIQGRSQTLDPLRIKINASQKPATLVVFDVLEYKGENLRDKPLIERKKYLKYVKGERVQVAPWHVVRDINEGKEIIIWAKKLGLEGLVAKLLDAPYRGKYRRSWFKLPNRSESVFKVLSYMPTKGKLHGGFVIMVDIGLEKPQKVAVQGLADREEIRGLLDSGKKIHVEVIYLQKNHSGRLRMPVFKRINKKEVV